MNLKKRLVLSNAAIVIIPVLITIAASFAFIMIFGGIFNIDNGYQNVKKLADIEYELFKASGSISRENSEILMEKEYQQYLAAKLSGINAEVIILKDHDIVFSTRNISKIDIEKSIEAAKQGFLHGSLKLEGTLYFVKATPVAFKDGDQGWVILLAPVGKEEAVFEKFLLFVILVFLISFVAASVLQSYAFSEKIINPLSRLQTAAMEISRGNLDHEVVEEGDAEIRKLCRSFEQMRLKLKESVYLQMKHDENRRMLVSSISHDLKTPITSIKGYVEGILDGVANTPQKTEKYLKTVYSKAAQVDAMIDDLLLYSKLDLKQIPFNFEKTDIARYFEDCVIENEPELEKANMKLSFQNQLQESRYVMIDRERFRRVVTNIIDNSRKYADKPDGHIWIILRENKSNIIIEIGDNGSGIPEQDLPHIFDRFYRGDSSRNAASGTGLGLAIAKQIVEGHGGKIWVRSRKNEGTSIMMSLKKIA